MRFLSALLFVTLAVQEPTFVSARVVDKRQITIDVNAFMNKQTQISWTGLYRNVGNTGDYARNVDPGCVIASPSTSDPDYYYQWTRDSALVFKVILNQLISGDSSVEVHLKNYVAESNKLQHTPNPSGDYNSGGLGEPKFQVNGAAFTGSWGRPQNDGPALRAIVLIEYANTLLDRGGDTRYVNNNLYQAVLPYNTVIKADLKYVSHNWQVDNFDLWEEVNAQHFFTLMVQRRALLAGAELVDRLSDGSAATWYRKQADAIGGVLPSFWSSSKNFLQATLNQSNRQSLDCGTLLGSLHGNGKRGWGMFPPESDEVLATLDALVNVFKSLYPINSNGAPGVAIGRYPEDIYNGTGNSVGNPWYLCTFTTAEIVYNVVKRYEDVGYITVGTKSLNFFLRFLPSATSDATYASGSANFNTIVNGMLQFADDQLGRAAYHTPDTGSLSEQYSRDNGFQKGARDLTWSYASFLTTAWARSGNVAF
ncbi:putative glucoamylase [Terfezia claveryi]|nr:putative glucoamylase [Terfezia claveryi]